MHPVIATVFEPMELKMIALSAKMSINPQINWLHAQWLALDEYEYKRTVDSRCKNKQ